MKVENSLEQIEKKYPVASLKTTTGLSVWPMLRQTVYFAILNKEVQYDSKLRTRNKWQLVKNLFYGIRQFTRLKHFDFVLFNNTEKRIPIDGKAFDIYADAWADRLGQNRSLFIEWASIAHLPKNEVHSQHILSDLPLKVLVGWYRYKISERIKDTSVIDQICKNYDLNIDVHAVFKSQMAEWKAYTWLFKKIKPKGLFVLSGFTKIMIVFAAKQLSIPVYEMQHGYIGSSHPFYSNVVHFKEFYPDYLLSFGSSELVQPSPHFIFDKEAILPVGSLRLELAKKKEIPLALENLQDQFRYLFCVTLQTIQDEAILKWVVNEAKLHDDWCFVVRPKQPNMDLSSYTIQSNVMVFPEISTYDVLKACDYNISIFSTTLIEGDFLGAKPILYNIDSLPKKYFDLERQEIALIEPGNSISEVDLKKPGTFSPPYFKGDYFKNVKETPLCF